MAPSKPWYPPCHPAVREEDVPCPKHARKDTLRLQNNVFSWLESAGHYRHLYRCQKELHRIDAAGETCIRLSRMSREADEGVMYLKLAKEHFHEAALAVQQRRDNVVVIRTQGELSTSQARVNLQLLIYEELLMKGHPPDGVEWTPKTCTMFTDGTRPTEEDTTRRLQIVQRLLVRNFHLAFRVIFEFKHPSMQCHRPKELIFRISEVDAYSNAVVSMALERKHKAILDLVNNIKGSVSDRQLDQILFHAVAAYVARQPQPEDGDWTHWFAEGLVELMISPHSKVRAFLKLGNIDAAFRLAKLHGAQQDLSLVMEAAASRHRHIFRSCQLILGRTRSRSME